MDKVSSKDDEKLLHSVSVYQPNRLPPTQPILYCWTIEKIISFSHALLSLYN